MVHNTIFVHVECVGFRPLKQPLLSPQSTLASSGLCTSACAAMSQAMSTV